MLAVNPLECWTPKKIHLLLKHTAHRDMCYAFPFAEPVILQVHYRSQEALKVDHRDNAFRQQSIGPHRTANVLHKAAMHASKYRMAYTHAIHGTELL